MSIIHNILGMNAQRQYGIVTGVKKKSTEKLSSGYRVNRAGDDAAGLAISEKMRRQIRGLSQASENIQDGIGFCQVADGYLNEVHDMMQRMNELVIKSANGTNSDEDREYIDEEVQQLKQEIQRIFSTAEFNEKKIWTSPYLPDVVGEAQDAQVFSSTVTPYGVSYPGGVEINDVRYNWAELGFSVSEDGGHYIWNQEKEILNSSGDSQDYSGERVVLRVRGDDPVGNVARDYQWKADDQGILINNVRAATWEQMNVDMEDNYGTVTFSFRGQEISFEVEDGASRQDIIAGINGDGYYSAVHWEFKATGESTNRPATNILEGTTIYATNSNEDRFDNVFEITADTNGVSIRNVTNSSDTDHNVMAWSDFRGTAKSGFVEPYQWQQGSTRDNGAAIDTGFPIVDWGLDQDNNDISQVTFDDSVYYTYEDNADLPIRFTYDLADETSQDAAINGLNGARFYGYISAPGSISFQKASSDGSTIKLLKNGIEDNFAVQRALKRNFNNSSENISGTIKKTYVAAPDRTTSTVNQTAPVKKAGSDSSNSQNVGTVYYEKDGKYYRANLTLQKDSYEEQRTTTTNNQYSGTYHYNAKVGSSRGMVDLLESTVSHEYIEEIQAFQKRTITDTIYRYDDEEEISAEDYAAISDEQKQSYQGSVVHNEGSWNTSGSGKRYFYDNSWHSTPPEYNDEISFKTQEGDEAFLFKFTYAGTDRNAHDTSVLFHPDGPAKRYMMADENLDYNVADHYSFNESRMYPPKKSLRIQSGVERQDGINLVWDTLNLTIVGLSATNARTAGAAGLAVNHLKYAMSMISQERSDFGAYQNRLEHAYNVDRNSEENTQAAESEIRDADMAKEMVGYSKANILAQVGESMIAQANQSKQGILNLLQ